MYQMDPQHTGRSPHVGPRDPSLRRAFETANFLIQDNVTPSADIQSSAAIGPDGTIYIANHLGVLFALRDPRRSPSPTAREREALQLAWRFHPPQESSWHSTPALAPDGTVYLGFSEGGNTAAAEGTLYALRAPADGIEGQVMWAVTLGPGRQTSSPTLGPDGTVYVVSGTGWLFAISPDGQVLWTVQTGPSLKSAPALSPDGTTVYVASMDGKLYAVAPPGPGVQQATLRWKFDLGQYAGRKPAVKSAPGRPTGRRRRHRQRRLADDRARRHGVHRRQQQQLLRDHAGRQAALGLRGRARDRGHLVDRGAQRRRRHAVLRRQQGRHLRRQCRGRLAAVAALHRRLGVQLARPGQSGHALHGQYGGPHHRHRGLPPAS